MLYVALPTDAQNIEKRFTLSAGDSGATLHSENQSTVCIKQDPGRECSIQDPLSVIHMLDVTMSVTVSLLVAVCCFIKPQVKISGTVLLS